MPRDSIAVEIDDLRQAAGHACRMMKVLSNPDRLLLLCPQAQAVMATLYQQFCPAAMEPFA